MKLLYKHNAKDDLCACRDCATHPTKAKSRLSPIIGIGKDDNIFTGSIERDYYHYKRFITPSTIRVWLKGIKDCENILGIGEAFEYSKSIIEAMKTIDVLKLYHIISCAYVKEGSPAGLPAVSYYCENTLPCDALNELKYVMSDIHKKALLSPAGMKDFFATTSIDDTIDLAFRRQDFHNFSRLPIELPERIIKEKIGDGINV